MKKKQDYVDYEKHLKSPYWRSLQTAKLKQQHNRCAMFPWLIIGKKVKGKYRSYNLHHKHYNTLGKEKLSDVIAVSEFAHWVIHALLGGAKRVQDQKSKYPNSAQRWMHLWCSLPVIMKAIVSVLFTVGSVAGVIAIRQFAIAQGIIGG